MSVIEKNQKENENNFKSYSINRNNSNITKNKSNIIIFIYCLIISSICLLFCSKSSPLYALNDWCDANTYFTIGKSMFYGLVPYKDLFEQKGPLLYFVHEIAYMLSHSSFLGVYIIEVVSFSIFLYFMNKIIGIFCSKKNSIWGISMLSFTILSSFVFASGDSAEEFCITFLSISFYYFLKYFKNIYPKKMTTRELIINGIMCGCVLWIKYTMLGFWIAFILFIVIARLMKKDYKEAVKSCLYFMLGIIIASIPWLIYFGANNALGDLFYTYFYVNMTAYSSNISIIKRIILALKSALAYSRHLPIFLVTAAFGYIFFMINKKMITNKIGKIAINFAIILSSIGIYYGNNYKYYFLFLMPFMIFGICSIGYILDKVIEKKTNKNPKLKLLYLALNILVTCGFIALTYINTPNRTNMNIDSSNLVQFKFAKFINEEQDKSILNYNFIDGGFYTVTNTIPNIKYFSMPNIEYNSYPIIKDEQDRYIREKVTNFVICKIEENNEINIKFLNENYIEVTRDKVEDDGVIYEYVLLKKCN